MWHSLSVQDLPYYLQLHKLYFHANVTNFREENDSYNDKDTQMPIIPNEIIIACHISRPLGAASQAGIKRESGSVLAPWWVEGRAAFLVGREAVTRAD